MTPRRAKRTRRMLREFQFLLREVGWRRWEVKERRGGSVKKSNRRRRMGTIMMRSGGLRNGDGDGGRR